MLVLAPDGGVEVDVDVFETAVARARETGALVDPPRRAAPLPRRAAARGPVRALGGRAAGRRSARRTGGCCSTVAALHDRAGDVAAATEALQQALLVDSLHEPAHRALMRLYAGTGRRQQALAQYQQLREALDRELAAAPDPQTAELYRALLRGEPVEPASGTGEPADDQRGARRAPQPAPGADELRRARARARRGRAAARPAPPGHADRAGRRRQDAPRVRARRATARAAVPDGVWLVELAPLGDPALVPSAIAAALGARAARRRDRRSTALARQLARRATLLLVLDNCEHLVGRVRALAERAAARAARTCAILATSREPLRVPGEVTWRVPSLALPDRARDAELARPRPCGCSASAPRAVQPSFALTRRQRRRPSPTICRRLDGMPLAIELAAARVAPCRPRRSPSGSTTRSPCSTAGRQPALDAPADAARHDRLEPRPADRERADAVPPARGVRRRLRARGGRGACRADDALPARDVADVLARLVDKSLVVAEDAAGGYRYRLLETMRQYARERLEQAGEEEALDACHLRATTWRPRARPTGTRRQPGAGARARQPARRVAVRAAPRSRTGPRARHERGPDVDVRRSLRRGRRLARRRSGRAPAPTQARADALRAKCGLDVRLGHTARIGMLGAERVAIFRRLADRPAVAHALGEQGVYEYQAGDYDRAERLYAESRALAGALGNDEVAAAVLHSVGVLALSRGEFEQAEAALRDSLARLRALSPDGADAFFPVHTNGLFVTPEGPGGAPRMLSKRPCRCSARSTPPAASATCSAARADVARAQRRHRRCHALLGESLEQFRSVGDVPGTAFVLNRLGNLAPALGEHDEGRERLEEALAIRRQLGDRRGVRMTLGNLGMLAARSGDGEAALRLIGDALAQFERDDDAPGQMGMLLNLGHLAADAGDTRRAVRLLEDSRARAERQRLFRCAGWTGLRLAELAFGDPARATALLAQARGRLAALKDRWGLERARELEQGVAKRPLSRPRQG